MIIIPGAAYLSPSEQRVYLATDNLPKPYFVTAPPGTSFTKEVSQDNAPADLILLYAPGDDVTDHTLQNRKYEDHDVCITRKVRDESH